jgi:hypothetical protein
MASRKKQLSSNEEKQEPATWSDMPHPGHIRNSMQTMERLQGLLDAYCAGGIHCTYIGCGGEARGVGTSFSKRAENIEKDKETSRAAAPAAGTAEAWKCSSHLEQRFRRNWKVWAKGNSPSKVLACIPGNR